MQQVIKQTLPLPVKTEIGKKVVAEMSKLSVIFLFNFAGRQPVRVVGR